MDISIIGWSFVVVVILIGFVSVLIQRRLTDLNKKIATLDGVVEQRLVAMDALVQERIAGVESRTTQAYNRRESRLQEREQRVDQGYYQAEKLAAELTLHIVNVTNQLYDYTEFFKASQSDTQAYSGGDSTPANSGTASEASTDTNTYPD
jgi:hypothetical protein